MTKIEIGYIEKANFGFRPHHIVKNVDIRFYPTYVTYRAIFSTWDLIQALVQADYEEYAGNRIIFNNVPYDLNKFLKLNAADFVDQKILVMLYCNAVAAERDVRYVIGYNDEGWDEYYRQWQL